jgi:hypothetical protein
MKTLTFTAVAEKAYGKTLATEIPYEGSFTAYENINEVRSANDMPSDATVIKWRNQERKSKARQASLTAALDAAGIVKPTIENDEQLRLRDMFKVLMSSKKYTEDAARELAATTLGLTWDEDED